ncbi:phytanoyl-CoA dioxygenase family protein [Micromonospora sp. NPDC023644]|uniref:phytanoyl-CoA dioxygenase family protein n=1 Tax=Micromonospora sp. NPDC023644 TaxID=3154321 RepID=UPI00340EB904
MAGRLADFAIREADRADRQALVDRLRRDSFLFLPGLLPVEMIAQVRQAVLDRLADVGWLAEGSDPKLALPGEQTHHDRGRMAGAYREDDQWRVGYRGVQSLECLHALAHCPELLGVLSTLLGGEPVVHPRKIARISFPGIVYPTPPHQDALFNKTTTDVLTVWIPLGDCPLPMGNLRVLRGSASDGALPVLPADGLGGERVDVDEDDPRWVEGDYRAGDVILFHGYTVHMAGANQSGQLRVSLDCRYQSSAEPVKPAVLLPHGFGAGVLPSWTDLTRDWASTRWVEVAQPVRIATVPPPVPAPSRLLSGASVDIPEAES